MVQDAPSTIRPWTWSTAATAGAAPSACAVVVTSAVMVSTISGADFRALGALFCFGPRCFLFEGLRETRFTVLAAMCASGRVVAEVVVCLLRGMQATE